MTRRLVVVLVVVLALGPGMDGGSQDTGFGSVSVDSVWTTEDDVTGRGRLFAVITGGDRPALFDRPYAVAWLGSRLFVTDPGRHTLVGLEPGKRPIRAREGALSCPVGITACGGELFVTDSERGVVVRFPPDLRSSEVIAGGLARPTGIACVDRRLFVLETGEHRIVELVGGSVVSRFGTRGRLDGEFNYPTLIAGREGELFVGDAMNFRVQRSTIDGTHISTFGEIGDTPGSMPRMKGLAVDPAGNVWMSDAWLDRIAVFDSSGRFLLDVGRSGSGGGEFSFPAGIAIHADGRVAVVDSFNARVQILRVEHFGEQR